MNRQIKSECFAAQHGTSPDSGSGSFNDSEIDAIPVVFGLYPNVCSYAGGKLHTLSNGHAWFGRSSCCSADTVHSLFVAFKRVVQLSGRMVLEEAMAAAPLLVLVVAMYHQKLRQSLQRSQKAQVSQKESKESQKESQKGLEKGLEKESQKESQKGSQKGLEKESQKGLEKELQGEEWCVTELKEGEVREGKETFVILYPLVGMSEVPS